MKSACYLWTTIILFNGYHSKGCEVEHVNNTAFPKEIMKYTCNGTNISPTGILSESNFNYEQFKTLAYLELQNEGINDIELNTFEHMTKLETLILSRNSLKSLRCCIFSRLNALVHLDLSENRLETFRDESIFKMLYKLKRLYLRKNLLISLGSENVFQDLKELELLNLSYNNLNSLPGNIFIGQNKLLTLDLSYNNFTDVSVIILHPLSQLNTLALEGNKFACDCKLKEVLFWTRTRQITTNLSCLESSTHREVSWDRVQNLTNCTDRENKSERLYIIIIPLIFGLLLGIYLKVRSRNRGKVEVMFDQHYDYISCSEYYSVVGTSSIPELPSRSNHVVYERSNGIYEDIMGCSHLENLKQAQDHKTENTKNRVVFLGNSNSYNDIYKRGTGPTHNDSVYFISSHKDSQVLSEEEIQFDKHVEVRTSAEKMRVNSLYY